MGFFEILLLSSALSTDAFGIGASCGLRGVKVPIYAKLIICLISVFVTGLSVFLGESINGFVPNCFGKFFGSFMLIVLGTYVIIGALTNKSIKKTKKSKNKSIRTLVFKPLGITISIIRDPKMCDIDSSSSLDFLEAVYIGFALSADSFAAGLGAGVGGGGNLILIPLMCGIFQLIFLCCGNKMGKKLLGIKCIKQKYFSVLSGIMLLIVAAIKIVF